MRNKASTQASHECGIFFFISKKYDEIKILFQFHKDQQRLYVNALINIGSNGNGWIKLNIHRHSFCMHSNIIILLNADHYTLHIQLVASLSLHLALTSFVAHSLTLKKWLLLSSIIVGLWSGDFIFLLSLLNYKEI